MDMLDHSMDNNGDGEEVLIDSKAILSENLTIVEEGSLGSGSEEHASVDQLTAHTLLENHPDEVHYSIRSSDGTITYRVLQVSEPDVDPLQTVHTFPNSSVPQVISPINGQLYVIGSSGEVFATQQPRTLAPRAGIIEPTTAISSSIKKVSTKRDERRRATHNEVERRRRDKINNWISKLSKIIPDMNTPTTDSSKSGTYEGQSKGGILAKACEYIMELRQSNQRLADCLKENEQLTAHMEKLETQMEEVKRENTLLRAHLVENGVSLPPELAET